MSLPFSLKNNAKPGHPDHPPIQVCGLSKVRYQKALAASWAPTLRAAAAIKVLAAWSARAVELETLILMAMEMMFFVVVFCCFVFDFWVCFVAVWLVLFCLVLLVFGLFCLGLFRFLLGLFCFAFFGWYCVFVCFVVLIVLYYFAWLFVWLLVCWLTGLFVGNCGVISSIGSREECCFMMALLGTKSWR